jgi:hypothetical protein
LAEGGGVDLSPSLLLPLNRATESHDPDEKICNEPIKPEHKTDHC